MNRRSVLRLLGLAPVAAPVAVAAASSPNLPPIDYSSLAARAANIERNAAAVDTALASRIDGVVARVGQGEASLGLTHPFTFDGETLSVPSVVLNPRRRLIAHG